MKKLRFVAIGLIIAMVLSTTGAFACTGLYVGKDVNVEGTTLIARSEDQGCGAYNKLFMVQPRITKAGRFMVDEGDDQKGFKVPLPKTTYKYTYLADASDAGDGVYSASCTNEYGLAVVGTISTEVSEEYEALDPVKETGSGLRESILPGLIACQAKTAKEAAQLCAKLHDKYGSEEWNTLFFADPNEAWIFENYGGHSYAALKMPADKVAVFGNQIMIDWIDPKDTENQILSKDLISNLDKVKNVVKDKDGRYNIVESISGGRHEYSNMRTWIGHKTFAPSDTGDYENDKFYSLFFTPENKVSVVDVMQIYGNRYEGTPYDMMKPENAGRRPIGVVRQSDVHIIQTLPELPADTCQLQWLAMGNAEHTVFVPAFSGITQTYDKYHTDWSKFSNDSMYFASKRICGLAESDREFLSQGVKDFNLLQEKMMLKKTQEQIAKIQKAYKKSKKEGRAYVTKLGIAAAKDQFVKTQNLYENLAYTQINNINDRVDNKRKVKFVADTRLVEAAKFMGYTVKKTTVGKDTKAYVLTKGDKTVKLNLDEASFTVEVKGKDAETIELNKAPYVEKGYVYVPMTVIEKL